MDSYYFLLFKALYVGLFTGLIIAIPMGPAGFESVRWTLTKGLKQGILVAAGSLIADAGDLILINFGLLSLIETNKLLEALFWIVSGLIIVYIGLKALRGAKKRHEEDSEKERKDKSSPVFAGFIVNFSNPMTHFFWLTLSSTVIRRWSSSGSLVYYTFISFMLLGMFTSLAAINYLASKGKKISAPKHSAKADRILAYIIGAFGIGFVVNGVIKLVELIS